MTQQAAKISDQDFQRLKDHVRLLHGLKKSADDEPPKATLLRRQSNVDVIRSAAATIAGGGGGGAVSSVATDAPPTGVDSDAAPAAPPLPPTTVKKRPRPNKTYLVRQQCVQKRLRGLRTSDSLQANELRRIRDRNNLKPKRVDHFKLNKAFHMRWKNIRGLPVVHAHFRNTFLDTGKPPFVVPVHYKPFNVYWDADWAKQEFIFLDAASDEKKKEADKKSKEKEKEQKETPMANKPTQNATSPKPHQATAAATAPTTGTEDGGDGGGGGGGGGSSSRKESSTSDEQQPLSLQPQFASSAASSRRRSDRESTGYEGEPRDSLLEREQVKHSYMARVSHAEGSASASYTQ